jgi:DNA invertase Pin-like site-specific DNA recombinase
MTLIGYARVSTTEQHLHLQQNALSAAGCLKIFTDIISGSKAARKGLAEALAYIRDGEPLLASPFNIVIICAVKLAMVASFSRWYGVHLG